MAALRLSCQSATVAANPGNPKTIMQIVAPANQRVKLLNILFSFDGVTANAVPAQVRVLRQTSPGTFTNATNPPRKLEPELTETPQTNFQTSATGEPTAGEVLDDFFMPVFNGLFKDYKPADEPIIIQGGGRLGIELTAQAAVNVKIVAIVEE